MSEKPTQDSPYLSYYSTVWIHPCLSGNQYTTAPDKSTLNTCEKPVELLLGVLAVFVGQGAFVDGCGGTGSLTKAGIIAKCSRVWYVENDPRQHSAVMSHMTRLSDKSIRDEYISDGQVMSDRSLEIRKRINWKDLSDAFDEKEERERDQKLVEIGLYYNFKILYIFLIFLF